MVDSTMTSLPWASRVKTDLLLFTLCVVGSKTGVPNTEVNDLTAGSYFSPFLAVWEVTVSREATGAETLPRIRVFWPLKAQTENKGHFPTYF